MKAKNMEYFLTYIRAFLILIKKKNQIIYLTYDIWDRSD